MNVTRDLVNDLMAPELGLSLWRNRRGLLRLDVLAPQVGILENGGVHNSPLHHRLVRYVPLLSPVERDVPEPLADDGDPLDKQHFGPRLHSHGCHGSSPRIRWRLHLLVERPHHFEQSDAVAGPSASVAGHPASSCGKLALERPHHCCVSALATCSCSPAGARCDIDGVVNRLAEHRRVHLLPGVHLDQPRVVPLPPDADVVQVPAEAAVAPLCRGSGL